MVCRDLQHCENTNDEKKMWAVLAFGDETTDARMHITTFLGETKTCDAWACQENHTKKRRVKPAAPIM